MGLPGRTPWLLLLLLLGLALAAVAVAAEASEGDADPLYKACVEECQKTGSLKDTSIKHCVVPTDGKPAVKSWYTHEPLYLQWKEWNCKSECRYHCMMERENERTELGLLPVKYHGKWPLKRASVFQEPLSAALSALTLVVQFNGWLSFFLLLYYKLPLRPETHKTYYEYTGLWHIYGLLAMNSWFWTAIYHSCDTIWTEKLHFSSAAAFLGYSLILAILRTSNLRDEASRVMVAAPILAFVTTHILYLNFYQLDKGLNMKVCIVISIVQFLLWALWAVMTRHPSRLKIIFFAIGGVVSVFLEAYDIPPRWGYVDGRAICLAVAIPLSYLWWSFAKEDAEMRTSAITKKTR
ncbi:post-GPI attachment to proteins factor 3-like [Panicum miliaceum]|uniref:Post-GPI attachment to proteins factor 3 n=1 Tax=Panicum miliaceum TaxID=4540 RepID=A0A3L6SFX2_PANMI|nr:post-GPI attachment to proteins factor 3-like [Panicum miliaceum]